MRHLLSGPAGILVLVCACLLSISCSSDKSAERGDSPMPIDHVQVNLQEAEELIQNGDCASALEQLAPMVGHIDPQKHPDEYGGLHFFMGFCYTVSASSTGSGSEWRHATEELDKTLTVVSETDEPEEYAYLQTLRGDSYRALAESEDAIGNLEKATEAYFHATVKFAEQKEAEMTQAVAGKLTETMITLGNAYNQEGRFAEAVEVFDKLLNLHPREHQPVLFGMVRFLQGLSYFAWAAQENGQFNMEKAVEAFRDTLDLLDPEEHADTLAKAEDMLLKAEEMLGR